MQWDQFLAFLISSLLIFSVIYWTIYAIGKSKSDNNLPECYSDFSYLTIKEKIEKLEEVKNDIGALEDLLTDMALCNNDHMKIVRLKWMSEDGKIRYYDIYCDGTDTATECLTAIAEREINDRKNELSAYSQILAEATRSNKISNKNNVNLSKREKWGRAFDAVRDLWR